MQFCEYKNALGVPGKGIHSYRIFNIAVVDVLLTFVLAYVIKLVGNYESYWYVLLYTFVAGILLHWVFCVDTTVNKVLFA